MSEQNEKRWLVVVRDTKLTASLIYLVRNVPSSLMACERIKEEYKRLNWGVPESLEAYRLSFRGSQTAVQVCQVFDAAPAAVDSDNYNYTPLVEWA